MSEVVISGGGFRPKAVQRAFLTAAERQMRKAMRAVEGEARRRAPFRTGHLRRTITSDVRVVGTSVMGTVGTALAYGRYLEEGTGVYGPRNRPIVPVHARALRFPAGGSASVFQGGRRVQGKAGPGFRLTGQQSQGKAGAKAQFVFRRSVRGVRPLRYFRDSIQTSQWAVQRELALVPEVAQQLLGAGK